jgi:hypothetical protein
VATVGPQQAQPSGINAPRGRLWQANEQFPDLTRRISRSTTVALLLSPAGLLLVSVIRLLLIAHYDTTTALAIASSGGYVNTLFGSVIPIIPLLLPYIAMVLLFSGRVILGLLAAVATCLVSPTTVRLSTVLQTSSGAWHRISTGGWIYAFVGLGVLVVLLLLVELVGIGYASVFRSLAAIAFVALIPLVIQAYPLPLHNSYYATLLKQPWLPAEVIQTSSGHTITGYVVADDQGWVTILNANTRVIYRYHASLISSRQVCQYGNSRARQPFLPLLAPAQDASRSKVPSCADLR